MLKRFHRDILLLIAALLVFAAALLLPAAWALAEWSEEEQQLWHAYQSGELIRIHVVANSDSDFDQSVKLCVRDALIEAFGEMLKSAGQKSSDAVFTILTENIELMQKTAETCARMNGYDGIVKAETGMLALPAKAYGNVVLPEGEYRALRITLGSGMGQNWWCVLYPQLCLAVAKEQQGAAISWDSLNIFKHWLVYPN